MMTSHIIFTAAFCFPFSSLRRGASVSFSIKFLAQQCLVLLAIFAVLGNVAGEEKVTVDSQINEIYDALDCIQETLNLIREVQEAQQGQSSLQSTEFHPRCRLSSLRTNSEVNGKGFQANVDKLSDQVEVNTKQIGILNEALGTLRTTQLKQEAPTKLIDYSAVSSKTGNGCGGFINLKGSQDIIYKLPDQFPPGYRDVCLWVVWAANGGPIRVEILADPAVSFQDDFQVTVNYAYTPLNSVPQNLTGVGWGDRFEAPFVAIFFYGRPTGPGQGVHLKVTDDGVSPAGLTPNVKYVDDTWKPPFYQHPPSPAETYGPNERLFMLFKGLHGKRLTLKVRDIDTEECCDWIEIDDFNVYDRRIYVFRLKGTNFDGVEKTYGEGLPIFLYFASDSSGQKRGFKVNFLYN